MKEQKNYLVTMIDRETGKCQRIIVCSPCEHGMQKFVDELVLQGAPDIHLSHPVVIDIDEDAVRHIPMRDTV